MWKTHVYKGARKTTHTVRWAVRGKPFRKPLATAALTDPYRSELVSATRRGDAFNCATGEPSSRQAGADAVNWYDFAVQFVDAQWERTAGNSLKNTAKVLTATTVAMLRTSGAAYQPVDVRTALREFAFNRILRANPLPKERGVIPKTSNTVDRRSLIHPHRMARILARIRRRPRGGRRLHAYFATLYYTAPRPEEAAAMYVEDVLLPREDAEDQWCDVTFHTAEPEVGKNWTDDGEIREQRGLKGRAEEDTRVVPGPPALTKILRSTSRRRG
ncbi:hypothetical protein [Streptomyces sp. cg2]|uniref:hypothetical protein n=1 Tax=Streptomyces sp. cg2 TaxID=3238799 RepID=UPI0034E1FE79